MTVNHGAVEGNFEPEPEPESDSFEVSVAKPSNVGTNKISRTVGWSASVILMASGLVHLAIWLFSGTQWEGDVSWRKPALFGISTGVTLASITWVAGMVPRRRYDDACLVLVSVGLVIEVGLITLQQWRGVPSHFNHDGWFNTIVEHGVSVLVIAASLYIFDLTWRSRKSTHPHADQRLAIQWGMVFLTLSCLIGYAAMIYGHQQKALGQPPGVVGDAGVVKFPHGIAIHAIQLFPVAAVFARWLCWSEKDRVTLVASLAFSMAFQLAFSLSQTLRGRSRVDVDAVSAMLLIAAAASLLPTVLIGGRYLMRLPRGKPVC